MGAKGPFLGGQWSYIDLGGQWSGANRLGGQSSIYPSDSVSDSETDRLAQ